MKNNILKELEEQEKKDLLDGFSYAELVELKLLAQKMTDNKGKLYFYWPSPKGIGRFIPALDCYTVLNEEETEKYVNNVFGNYKDLVSNSTSIEDFISKLADVPSNDMVEENTYTGSFSLDFAYGLVVDEATALRANAMIFEGKSKQEVFEYVEKYNRSGYVYIPGSMFVSFKSGQKDEKGSDLTLISSLYAATSQKPVIVNFDALAAYLFDLGFSIYSPILKSDWPDQIYSSLAYEGIGEDYLYVIDKNLELDLEDKKFTVFPKQKVK